ncbi:MAG: B12-binding domain-containing radical SAM protein [Acidobacteria bacterium]|nr:MAG: B12-binding domain-containing radical SAM protein [Acidobacteriota bacterium]
MKISRIILFNPVSSARRTPVLPMSLLAIEAALEGRWPTEIVDGNLMTDSLEYLDAEIDGDGATTILAITVMPGPQLEHATPLCRELKERHPELTIIWGGYFPSQHWEACLKDCAIDFVVQGHGEAVFTSLLEHLETGSPTLESIAGLAWKDQNQPRSNERPPVPHPAKLPEWNLESVDIGRYLRPTFLGSKTIGLHSSYGCPYFCAFCAVVTMVEGRWMAWSAERTAETVHRLHRDWAADAIEFNDNNFFVDERRVVEFSERIQDLGINWWGEGRIDTMMAFEDSTWRVMRDSGLKMVFLGAESGSEDTLKLMDKGGSVSPEMTLEMVRRMREWSIVPELSFVLGNPPDAEADALNTMEFIRQVKAANPATEIILYLYTPVPLAGALFDQVRASGFAFPETLDQWISGDWLDFVQRRSDLPWVGPKLQSQIKNFERVLNAYYPTTTLPSLTPPKRLLLRAASAWRYHLRFNAAPLELAALHRLLRYRRPESSGF